MKTRAIVLAGTLLVAAMSQALATTLDELSGELTRLVAAAAPSVVQVRTERQTLSLRGSSITADRDDLFRYPSGGNLSLAFPVGLSVGSGFVIDPAGYILTTSSVVSGASKITVEFSDGTEADAQLKGEDSLTRAAILKVEKAGLKSVPLGDSSALQLGSLVVSINSQAGMESTVSLGMVAGIGRSMADVGQVFQVSGTVGPGASGGPVLDSSGKVVGVTFAMLSPSDCALPFNYPSVIIEGKTSDALSKALGELDVRRDENQLKEAQIKLDLAKSEMEWAQELTTSGMAGRDELLKKEADLGLAETSVEAKRIDLEKTRKALELWQTRAKPVYQDCLKSVAPTTRVSGSSGFAIPIDRIKPILEELKAGKEPERGYLGVTLSEKDSRIVVTSVSEGAPAASAGLKCGDVLIRADGRPIMSTDAFSSYVLELKPGTALALVVEREGRECQISVTIGKRPKPEEPENVKEIPLLGKLFGLPKSGEGLSISLSDAGIAEVAKKLAEASGTSVIVVEPERIRKKVTVEIKSLTLEKALDVICRTLGCTYAKDGEAYVVRPK